VLFETVPWRKKEKKLKIEQCLEDRCAVIANHESTIRLENVRHCHTAPDVAIVSGALAVNFQWTSTHDSRGSDHRPCLLSIRVANDEFIERRFSTRKWNQKNIDRINYQE